MTKESVEKIEGLTMGNQTAGITDNFWLAQVGRSQYQKKSLTRLFKDSVGICARSSIYMEKGCIGIQEFEKCPRCSKMSHSEDDGFKAWIDCENCGVIPK